MQAVQDKRRLIFLIIIIVLIVCLLGVLAYRVLNPEGGGNEVAGGPAPTATVASDEEDSDSVDVDVDEENTPTPTRVISEEATEEPTEEATVEPEEESDEDTEAPELEASPTSNEADTSDSAGAELTLAVTTKEVLMVEVTKTGDVLKNGDFEDGFSDSGVALHWNEFRSTGGVVGFSAESAEPFVYSGDSAQRVSIEFAHEPDQIGGIYQTVEVMPGEPYTLTLYGQIRSGFGDVEASSYGYRIQYAIDYTGSQNWQSITSTDWVEIPWPEQMLNTPEVTFSTYSTEIIPTGEELTLFVRGWNKWPNGSLSEYTFDAFSLEGSIPGSTELVAATSTTGVTSGEEGTVVVVTKDEAMVDKALPVTGYSDGNNMFADGRFWGAVMVLVLLAGGAIYRSKWGW